MSDENTNMEEQEQEQPQEKSIWELLDVPEPEGEQYEEEEEEQDEAIAKQDKLEKKMTAKMDNMTKKFEQTMLRERLNKFESEADELTLDMFKTVASDVKTLEDFDKALKVVNKQAESLRAKAAEYQKKMEMEAAEQTSRAWGTGPLGTPTKRSQTDDEERQQKIAKGDTHAGLAALLEGDKMVGDII